MRPLFIYKYKPDEKQLRYDFAEMFNKNASILESVYMRKDQLGQTIINRNTQILNHLGNLAKNRNETSRKMSMISRGEIFNSSVSIQKIEKDQ
jgi:hypothetical protein